MQKLENSLLHGNDIFNKTQEKYNDIVLQLQGELELDEENILLLNKKNNLITKIQYVKFIQSEFNKINNFNKIGSNGNCQNGCMYFGNGNLYYNDELLKYNESKIFDSILNHIIHYTGCLYVMNSSKARMSYILSAINTCYGINTDFSNINKIYENNIKKSKRTIFDTNECYFDFILNNIQHMKFIKTNIDNQLDLDSKITYRIIVGDKIILQNMILNIKNNKVIDIMDCDNEENELFYKLF